MPRVLVYEYLTAHGIGRDPASADHGMYREGLAMRDAVASDFGAISNFQVTSAGHFAAPASAAEFDYVLVIAPELGDQLVRDIGLSIDAGGRPVNSGYHATRATTDKLKLAVDWDRNGVRTPTTTRAGEWDSNRVPCVIKPRGGAGSCSVFLVHDPADYDTYCAQSVKEIGGQAIAQDFIPGRPASIAFLIGPNQTLPLPPTFQRLTADGRFHYLGGELPIPPALAARAVALGRRAVECVPGLAGYVGVDLVLGDAADGSADYAIEINPRLTTSYVGLRALAEFNIAGAMLDVFEGRPVGELRWKPGRVRFDAGGRAEYDDSSGAFWE